MLKSVLYCLLFITTAARFTDIIYLLVKDNTNLPIPVIIITTTMIIYGIVLLAKKFVGNVTLKQLMMFYMVQTAMIVFNLSYISVACPLHINIAETVVVGTFLDIVINCGIIYFCTKQIRSHYFAVAQPVVTTNRNA